MLLKKINLLSKIHNFARYNQCKNFNYSSFRKIGVVGVPFCKGQKKSGTEEAPKYLREMGLLENLKEIANLNVKDYGDISYTLENVKPMENALNYSDVYSVNKVLSTKVQNILKEMDQYLVLGGDHSIAIGSIAGHLAHDPNISVIWIDAHADINTNISSLSGNVHGMPLSMIIDELKHCYIKEDISKLMKNYLPAKNLYYIGLRDVEPFEHSFIKKQGIKAFTIKDIDQYGISKIMEIILDSIKKSESNIHISFDIDSLDPSIAPSTGTAVMGGLMHREIFYIFEELYNTGKVTGFDITEINPQIGEKLKVEQTIKAGIEAIKVIMGQKRLQ